ncbi:hypothetical protein VNO77_18566 [Canavalia gladiata]|uniref:Uncharacterized protein n=1 Tax=Canavalia gladiata TaxID=3824 RepID=A0AAN9LPY8_CANGL
MKGIKNVGVSALPNTYLLPPTHFALPIMQIYNTRQNSSIVLINNRPHQRIFPIPESSSSSYFAHSCRIILINVFCPFLNRPHQHILPIPGISHQLAVLFIPIASHLFGLW